MGRERFEELVAEALDEVPAELLALMDNVVVLVEDDASRDSEHTRFAILADGDPARVIELPGSLE